MYFIYSYRYHENLYGICLYISQKKSKPLKVIGTS